MVPAAEGGIEDIVIPDDIGEVATEEKPEVEKTEDTADKKDEEMPF